MRGSTEYGGSYYGGWRDRQHSSPTSSTAWRANWPGRQASRPVQPAASRPPVAPVRRTAGFGSLRRDVAARVAGRSYLGYFSQAGVQPIPDLLRGVGATAALVPGDQHSGGGDTREACQSHYFPPAHVPTLASVTAASISIDSALDETPAMG